MRLSKRGEYGLRAAIHLANAQKHSPDAMVQIKDISVQEKIPTKYLEQILLALKNAGLLQSKMGVGGGYYLAKAAGTNQPGTDHPCAGWAAGAYPLRESHGI